MKVIILMGVILLITRVITTHELPSGGFFNATGHRDTKKRAV